MAEILEEPVRSEHEADVNAQTENKATLEEDIALVRDLPVNAVVPSEFTEFLEREVDERNTPPPMEEKAPQVNVDEVTGEIIEAVQAGTPYYEILKSLPREQIHEVIQMVNEKIREAVEKDAHSEGEISPERMRRAKYIINHSAKIFDTEDAVVLNYITDIDAKLGLQALDSATGVRGNNTGTGLVVFSTKGEEKLVLKILEDLTEQLNNGGLEPEKAKGRIEYLMHNLTEDQRDSLPDNTKTFLLEYERKQILNFAIELENAGYFTASRFSQLEAAEKAYILQSMKGEITSFLEKKEGEVKRIESEARILLGVTTEEERQNWPEALREYVEAPHHDYTELPQEEQFESIYKDVTNSLLDDHEFRLHMARLPREVKEKLLEKVLEDSTAYAAGKIAGSAFQSNRLEHGSIIMSVLHKDTNAIATFRDKLELDLAKGRVHWAEKFDNEKRGEYSYWEGKGRFERVNTFMKAADNPEAKKVYIEYIQNFDLKFIGNTKALETQLKALSEEDGIMTREVKDPSTILLGDKKSTMKEYLLKQDGIEERKDGSLFIKDKDGEVYNVATSYAKHSNNTEARYVKVISQRDPLTFKVLELNEFQEKMKSGGVHQIIKDAKQSRKDEVTNKDVLEEYDLPMNEKTVIVRAFPVSPDKTIASELYHGHLLATALRARYGEAVDIKPITFGKEMMLQQIDEAYKAGSRSFFVNASGHGGKHGSHGEGVYLDDGQFTGEDIQKLLEKYPEAHFIVATDGCYGGGLAAGVEEFKEDKPELAKRLILMTQTKPDIVSYGGHLGGVYEATFLKSLYNGDTFGEAIRNADMENKKQRSMDADTIIHGIKVGDVRAVKAEDLMV